MSFKDRQTAGRELARSLHSYSMSHPIVVALPRGGVPIGLEIAKTLHAPLEVLIVRKLGAPHNPEYGIGALAENGYYWLNDDAVEKLGITQAQIEALLKKEVVEVNHRIQKYRNQAPLQSVQGRTVILADDGLATGITALAASEFLRQAGAKEIIVACPVCAKESAALLRNQKNTVACLQTPENFYSVGMWYDNFDQLSDRDVTDLLNAYRFTFDADVKISNHEAVLEGHLTLPTAFEGIVIFAHGSGSSRLSPRNIQVAQTLNQKQLGTLLFDLLTPAESQNQENVFNIPFLANRLIQATHWIMTQNWYAGQPIGFFGASTGGGAALWAAAELNERIAAIVSRGGRPDLAQVRLKQVTTPTLLIVGGNDEPVIQMNQEALSSLKAGRLMIIDGATHLFEEQGALEAVAVSAANWFKLHFQAQNTIEQKYG